MNGEAYTGSNFLYGDAGGYISRSSQAQMAQDFYFGPHAYNSWWKRLILLFTLSVSAKAFGIYDHRRAVASTYG